MTNGDARHESGLDELFHRYRAACPDVEPSAGFMPSVWQRIEARQNFWFAFGRFGKLATTASAAIVLVLAALNVISSETTRATVPSYVDALMADHSAERVYYTEAIPPASGEFADPAR